MSREVVEQPPAKRAKADDPTLVDAHAVVTLHLVTASSAESLFAEIRDGGFGEPFKAEFLHQHFGDEEQIKGFRGLQIDIWWHATTFHAWVDIRHEKRRPGADKLDHIFREKFPSGYFKSQDDFVAAAVAGLASMPTLSEVGKRLGEAVPMGGLAATATPGGLAGAGDAAVIQWMQLSTAPAPVKEMHGRMEALLLFFIDGANFIDANDPQWELLLVVPAPAPPRYIHTTAGAAAAGSNSNCVLGMTTIYDFWAYPASRRLRVSQVLVPPPFQGRGLGKRLLQASYGIAQERDVLDLTVEDPTPNLLRVREKLEAEMMLGVDWIRAQVSACVDSLLLLSEACGGNRVSGSRPDTPASTSPEQPRADASTSAPSAAYVATTALPSSALTLEELTKATSGRGVGSAGQSSSSSGSGASALLLPSRAQVARITKELKMYRAEVRIVWEVLLSLHPAMAQEGSPGAVALTRLVRDRVASAPHFAASCMSDSVGKVIINSKTDTRVFVMMKTRAGTAAAAALPPVSGGPAPETTAAGPSGSHDAMDEDGTVAAPGGGRFNPGALNLAERDTRLVEMLEERLAGMQLTSRLLRKGGHGLAAVGRPPAVAPMAG